MEKREKKWEKEDKSSDVSLPVSYGESSEEVSEPESYYHDITTPAEGEDRYYEIFEKTKYKTRGLSVAALIVGIASVAFCYFGWAGLILGVIAVALSVASRIMLGYFDGMAIAGLILGIFGIVFGGAMLIINTLIDEGKIENFFKKQN